MNMKKNLLCFIGAVLSCLSIFFLGAPYFSTSSSSSTTTVSIFDFLGIARSNSSYSSSYFSSILTTQSLALLVSIVVSFLFLIVVISCIITNKKNSMIMLALSSIQGLAALFILKGIVGYVEASASTSTSYTTTVYSAGWGIIIIIILLLISFVLALVQYILDMVEIRKNMNESEYAEIYKFKKLLDDGIISEEDYENKKKEFLDSVSNNKE